MSPCYFREVQSSVSWFVMLTLVLHHDSALAKPPGAVESTPIVTSIPIRFGDVALKRGGVLQGQVVNGAGVGVSDVVVELSHGQQTWQTKSGSDGWFQLTGLRGGSYQFQAAGQSRMLRAWADGTAPPHANQGVFVARSTDVVRGQRVVSPNTNQFFRVAKRRLTNPWVVGGIVVTAVTVPVAIHNADDDDPPATP